MLPAPNWRTGFTHLTLEDRIAIQAGVNAGSSKATIAASLGKDSTTIAKEIKAHRFPFRSSAFPLECRQYTNCPHGHNCREGCPDYAPFQCTRRDRSPGVCNGCEGRSVCPFHQFEYDAVRAQREYELLRTESRKGANLLPEEARRIAKIVGPLLKEGKSPAKICAAHPDLGITTHTLYNYLQSGVLTP